MIYGCLLSAALLIGMGLGIPAYAEISISDIPDRTVNIHSTLRIIVLTTNATGDVQYSIDSPLEGAQINPDTGLLVYVPVTGQNGSQTITVRATDDNNSTTANVAVTVGDPIVTIQNLTATPTGNKVDYTVGNSNVAARFFLKSGSSSPGALSPPDRPNAGEVVLGFESYDMTFEPRPDTLYYLQFRIRGSTTTADEYVYAQFTPKEPGFTIIPNPSLGLANIPPIASDATVVATTGGGAITVDLAALGYISDSEDGTGELVVSIPTQPALGSANVSSSTTIQYTPGSSAGRDTLVYTVTDTGGMNATGTITVNVRDPVTAPASGFGLVSVPDQNVTAHSMLRINITTTNHTGSVQYSLDPPVEGASINATTGRLVWFPAIDQIGDRIITVRATDDTDSVIGDIAVTVNAPIAAIQSLTTKTGARSSIDYTIGNQTVQVQYQSLSEGVTTDRSVASPVDPYARITGHTSSSLLSHPEPDTIYYVEFRPGPPYTKGLDSNLYVQFTPKEPGFTIIPNPLIIPPNQPPVAPNLEGSIDSGSPITFMPEISDPEDGVPVIVHVEGARLGSTNFTNTTITYIPDASANGTDTITYTVTDTGGLNDTGTITVDITFNITAVGFTIISVPDQTVTARSTLSINVTAANQEGPVQYSLDPPVAGASINATTGRLVWFPSTDQIGDRTITVRATEGNNSAAANITVTVGDPIVTIQRLATTSTGNQIDYTVGDRAVVIQYQSLSDGVLTSRSLPSSAGPLVTNTGFRSSSLLSHPEPDTIYYVEFRPGPPYTKSIDSNLYVQFTPWEEGFTIIPNPFTIRLNQPPVAPTIVRDIGNGSTITITPEISDPEAPGPGDIQPVIVHVEGARLGSTNFTNTTITYISNADLHGTDTITYTVRDKDGQNATGMITVNVRIDGPDIIPVPDQAVNVHSTLRVDVATENATGTVQYSIDPSLEGAQINPDTGLLVYVPVAGHNGSQTITVRATDTIGSTTADIAVTVGDPIVTIQSLTATMTGNKVDYTVGGSDVAARFFLKSGSSSPSPISPSNAPRAGDVVLGFQSNDMLFEPRPDTIYYVQFKIQGSPTSPDAYIYAQFAPKQPGFTIIPNPELGLTNIPPTASDATVVATTGGGAITVDLAALGYISDSEDGTGELVVSILTQPALGSATATPDSAIIQYTPGSRAGTDTLVYTVTDTGSMNATGTITINVRDPVTAPASGFGLEPVPDQTVTARSTLRVNITATNNTGSVQYSLDPPVEGASINAITGRLVWLPTLDQIGHRIITVRATDDTDSVIGDIAVTVDNTIVAIQGLETTATGNEIDYTAGSRGIQAQYRSLSEDNATSMGAISTLGSFASNSLGRSMIPLQPDTLYFVEFGTDLLHKEIDTNLYVRFTPRESGFTIIPNPFTVTLNQPPVAPDIEHSIDNGSAITITPVISDPEAPGPGDIQPVIAQAKGAMLGSTNFSETAITYTPNEDQHGTDTITYTVRDKDGQTAIGTLTIMLARPTDTPPMAPTVSVTGDEDTVIVIMPEISDPDGGTPVITGVTNGTLGTAVHSDTAITYTPRDDLYGTDMINYTITDDENENATGTITINITSVNDDPVLGALGNRVENAGDLVSFTINAHDADNDPLRFNITSALANATVDPITGVFNWMPTSGNIGNHSVTITVSDGQGGTDSETITIRVVPAGQATNQPPALISIGNRVVSEGQTLQIRPNATDTENDPLTYALTRNTLPAEAAFDTTNGYLDWTPGESDGDTSHNITITVSDQNGTDAEDITITVRESNHDPSINAVPMQNVTTGETVTIMLDADDADIPEQTLSYDIISNDLGAIISNNTLSWTPQPVHAGNRSLTVRVQDNFVPPGSNSTTISFMVHLAPIPNHPPVAPSSELNTDHRTPVVVTPEISDPEAPGPGDIQPVIVRVEGARLGSTNFTNTTITYTPDRGSSGTDTITYTVRDKDGQNSTGTINITVTNMPPTATNSPFTTFLVYVNENRLIDLAATGMIGDAEDDAEDLTVSITRIVPARIQAEVVNGTTISIKARNSGNAIISYTVTDTDGMSADGRIRVSVLDTPPVASDATINTTAGGVSVDINMSEYIEDEDYAADLRLEISADPSLGNATVLGSTIIRYTTGNIGGTDTMNYTVIDTSNLTDEATITIIVNASSPPVAPDISVSIRQNATATLTPAISDPDGGTPVITGVTNGTLGTAVHTGTSVTYTPDEGQLGTDTITYTVTDNEGDISTGVITINIVSGDVRVRSCTR